MMRSIRASALTVLPDEIAPASLMPIAITQQPFEPELSSPATAFSASVPGPPTTARPLSASTFTDVAPTRRYCADAVSLGLGNADALSAFTDVESPTWTTEVQRDVALPGEGTFGMMSPSPSSDDELGSPESDNRELASPPNAPAMSSTGAADAKAGALIPAATTTPSAIMPRRLNADREVVLDEILRTTLVTVVTLNTSVPYAATAEGKVSSARDVLVDRAW